MAVSRTRELKVLTKYQETLLALWRTSSVQSYWTYSYRHRLALQAARKPRLRFLRSSLKFLPERTSLDQTACQRQRTRPSRIRHRQRFINANHSLAPSLQTCSGFSLAIDRLFNLERIESQCEAPPSTAHCSLLNHKNEVPIHPLTRTEQTNIVDFWRDPLILCLQD